MKIRLLISRAGVRFAYAAGEEIDVSDDEARRLIAAGKAVPVEPTPEKAVRSEPPQEKRRSGRRR